MALATKTQSQNIFSKLKSKPANKVRCLAGRGHGGQEGLTVDCRYASTAAQRTQHGAPCRSASTCASTAPRTTVIWVFTSPLSGPPTSTVRLPPHIGSSTAQHNTREVAWLTGNSLAMGSAAHHEGRRQRERDQVLPIARRLGCACKQGLQGQVHQQRSHQVQGGAAKAVRRRRQVVSHVDTYNYCRH